MKLKDLIKKPYWSPYDLSLAMGVSVSAAREIIKKLRSELESQGYINLNKSKVPTKILIEKLNIDLDWLERNGGLELDLTKEEY